MISLKQFFADHVKYFCNLFKREKNVKGIKEIARRAVLHFVENLKLRMEERIQELEPEDVTDTVIGWFANISASVPNENDEEGIEETGAEETELKLDFGPFHIDTRPPAPRPPLPPDRRHRRPGPPPPPPHHHHHHHEPPKPPRPKR